MTLQFTFVLCGELHRPTPESGLIRAVVFGACEDSTVHRTRGLMLPDDDFAEEGEVSSRFAHDVLLSNNFKLSSSLSDST